MCQHFLGRVYNTPFMALCFVRCFFGYRALLGGLDFGSRSEKQEPDPKIQGVI